MNAFARNYCCPFVLSVALVLHCYGVAPGLPQQELRDEPPSGQSFRQWTERQHKGNTFAMLAPGSNLTVVQVSQPVRIPFFIVSLKDSPPILLQDKQAVIAKVKERIFGNPSNPNDSLQGYYNQLFAGKLSFFDAADVIPLELQGNVSDYFASPVEPTKKLFQDIKDALSQTQIPLEVYNNKQLNGQANGITTVEDELDLVVIFILARSNQGMWPLRWWYEWTTET